MVRSSPLLSVLSFTLLVAAAPAEPATPRVLRHDSTVSALAFSPDGKMLASADWDKNVHFWDVATGKELHTCTGHQGEIECLAFAPDGKTVATGAWDKTIRLWDAASGKELRQIGSHPDGILCLAFSPDGTTLVSGNQDQNARQGTLHLWDVATGKLRLSIAGHSSPVTALAFSPDGKVLASGSADRTIRLWEPGSGKELACLQGHEDWIFAVAFSPDGRLLASVAGDTSVRLWDLTTNKQRFLFTGHAGKVRAVSFTRDGRTVVSGGYDRSVRFWEVASGQERLRVIAHRRGVRTLAFTPDGKTLATGSTDGTVRLADVADLILAGQPPKETLPEKELATLWTDLGGTDAVRAYQAVGGLVSAPRQAIPMLHERLKQLPSADTKLIARLIADLDSDQFAVRKKATQELEKLGDLARPALEKAAAEGAAIEVRRRAQELLDKLNGPVTSGERLQVVRAVEVLEWIGDAEAKRVLEALAAGTPEAVLTQEAKAALGRMTLRPMP